MSREGPVAELPSVTLGGTPLSLAVGQSHSWSLVSGTQAHQAVFEMSTFRAIEVHARGAKQQADPNAASSGTRTRDKPAPFGPLTLEMRVPGKAPLVIQGLYVLATQPGSSRNTLGLLVADRRCWWKRVMVERAYNIRKRTGEFRVLQGEVRPLQVATRAADVTYAPATLNGDRPWTAREILEDVLTELCGQGGFVIDEDLPFADAVEGLELHGPGDEALQRVLGFLPGAAVYAHPDGRIHVYNTLRNGEIRVASSVGAPLWGTGDWTIVDRSLLRPQRVHVYFMREIETRFDYEELADGETGSTRTRLREPRELENVLPNPDPSLTLTSGRVVAAGTWITIDEALDAWNALEDFPADLGALTQARIRRFYMAGLSFLHHLFSQQLGTSEVNVVWARRINALQEHWRRSFRLLPAWRDKIRHIRAYRCAVVDEETGTRAKADAYFDHVVKLGARGLTKWAKGDDLGWNTTSWAEDLADAKVAPADVEVLDEDNGIIRITPRLDLGGLATAVAPGTVDVIPKATAGEVTTLWGQTELAANWKLSLVVTCVQAVPNGLGRLHQETVDAADALALLPGVVAGKMNGPDFETFVDIDTARFGWVDSHATAIEEAFFDGKPPPAAVMVNPETIRALARAQAARVHATFLDRGEGSFAVSLRPEVVPVGSLAQVTHRVARPDERTVLTTTTLVMPPIVVPPSITSMLPEGIRRAVQKLVSL